MLYKFRSLFRKDKKSVDRLLDTIENHINYKSRSSEEMILNVVSKEMAEFKNLGFSIQRDKDFLFLTVIELLDILISTEKDKKKKAVYKKGKENIKKHINLLTPEQEKELIRGGR